MALSGIQIFKQLPKTNCKDCGYPTCMAFALQLAAGKTSLSACPHLAAEVQAALEAVAASPIRRVEIGRPDDPIVLGEESVLYRHEKRFEHGPALTFMVDDSVDDRSFDLVLRAFRSQRFERVGEVLRPRLIAVESADVDLLTTRLKRAVEETDAGVMVVNEDPEVLLEAGGAVRSARPLLCGATSATIDRAMEVARELGAPLVLRGGSMEELGELGRRCLDAGFGQVLLEPVVSSAGAAMQAQVFLRRAAIRDKVTALGFPTVAFPCRLAADPHLQTVVAAALIAKYAGVVVVDTVDAAHTLSLLTLSQGLYTDPQKPMMVEAGIYPLGNPSSKSPVLLTTNFSLTYYTVVGEIENSKVPAWLLVMDVDGQSVLTAWAAGKFTPETIAPFVKKCGIEERVEHRTLVIPGYVASIRNELESELGDWSVAVGVREAADIPRYLRASGEERS